ncbi:helix-turn-helix domain protein [Paraburkholderia xenovorans LB400]|uniref:Transcriptional regulator, AraC family n=2 Tax=Paraburkholderia xenovorans TaxID=36873 RepID=Q13H48_PARXL|nr:transcriptional regulator, AraC family [Paraburkholderia xenovorans LB400]AIP34233.1 helix-turn-helix domain protein [Paraburkholderia xenovorans LB400]
MRGGGVVNGGNGNGAVRQRIRATGQSAPDNVAQGEDDMGGVVDYAAGNSSASMSRAIRRSIVLIESSFAQPVSLATLAAAAGLSVSRFATLFRKEVGMPPHRYVCLVRIGHARRLLRDGVPPCAVATEVGFFDQSHFGRHFRRVVGVTPGHFVASPESERALG